MRVAPLLGPSRPVVVVGEHRSTSPWRSGERTWFRTRGSQVRVLPGTRTASMNAFVAQWKARLTTNQEVGGSSPSKGTGTARYCENRSAPLAEMALAPGFYPGDGGSSPSRRTCPAGHRVAEMRRPPRDRYIDRSNRRGLGAPPNRTNAHPARWAPHRLPSYPNWQRTSAQTRCVVGSTPSEGTVIEATVGSSRQAVTLVGPFGPRGFDSRRSHSPQHDLPSWPNGEGGGFLRRRVQVRLLPRARTTILAS